MPIVKPNEFITVKSLRLGEQTLEVDAEGATLREICEALSISPAGLTFVINGETRVTDANVVVKGGTEVEILDKPKAGF